MLRPYHDGCEFSPRTGEAAYDNDPHYRATKATVIVGARGQWRLCNDCASLPRFRRFKKTWIMPLDRAVRQLKEAPDAE